MITHKDRVLASELVKLANDLKNAIDLVYVVNFDVERGDAHAEERLGYELCDARNFARYTRDKLDEIFKLLEIDDVPARE